MVGAIIKLLIFAFLLGNSSCMDSNVDITCSTCSSCSSDDTCVETYKLHRFTKGIPYKGSDTLNGTLQHGITIASDGKCFNPRFKFRGVSDFVWAHWDLPTLDTPTPVKELKGKQLKQFFYKEGIPTFSQRKLPEITLCQTIAAARMIDYQPCPGSRSGVETGAEKKKENDVEVYRRFYSASEINPVIAWLNKKADDKNYPSVEFSNDTHISIDWGEAATFKCGEDIKSLKIDTLSHVSGSYDITLKGLNKNGKSHTIPHDRFKFEKEYINIESLTKLEDPKCYSYPVQITLHLNFYSLKTDAKYHESPKDLDKQRESKQYTPEILSTSIQSTLSSNGPNGENDLEDNSKIKTHNKTETYLFIQHKDEKAPINCLQKKVMVENMNNNEEHEVEVIDGNRVNLTSFIVVQCEETRLQVTAKNTSNKVVIDKYYTFLPTVNAANTNNSKEDGAGHLIVNEAKFEGCEHLKFEVVCEEIDKASDKNLTNREILGYNKTTKKSDEFKMKGRCKARAFLCEGGNETCSHIKIESDWEYFYGQPSAHVGSNTAIGGGIGSVIGVLAIASAVVMFMRFKEKKTREEDKEELLKKVKVKTESGPIPEHVVFTKDDNLGNFLIDITNLQAEVIDEFNALEIYDDKYIKAKETTNTATSQLNLSRNRYKDMVPYDSSLLLLNRATGDPPSRYINASIVKFPGWEQKFLAVQAPKPNMFSGFWQLVMEHNVTVIAMITGLIEGGKVKAHQYWPDDDDTKKMILDNGIEVEMISVDKTRSVFHHRKFKVTNKGNVSITVDHLLCVEWEDMTAPKDTKVLRDLVEQADLLVDDTPGTILVHCSAGVGRTGTFIGYYKMRQDNDNDELDRIDPFETVLHMRRARTKMVQKPLQYHYMMKCLSDEVTGETSVYS